MELNNDFTVNVPIAEAWVTLTDLERIAPCMPGAQLEEVEGDVYRGFIKVKVGPILAQFKGEAQFLEKDDVNYRAVIKGKGRDTGGKGNADANIVAQLTSVDANSTKVSVNTDLNVTGKVAQFGRGAMADISNKLLGQFVTNLETTVLNEPRPTAPVAAVVEAAAVVVEAAPVEATVAAPAAAPVAAPPVSNEGVRKITPVKEVEALDLMGVARGALVKRLLPVGGVVLLIVLWLWKRR